MQPLEIGLAILAVIGFTSGFPQLWGSNWKEIWNYSHKGIITWSVVHKSILNVIEHLRKKNIRPNVIVGVGRGGIICAGLLCSELTGEELAEKSKRKKSPIRSSKIRLETINSTIYLKDKSNEQSYGMERDLTPKIDRIELSDVGLEILKDEKILVVVAQTFTGNTLEKATKLLLDKGISRNHIITVTVFWQKNKSIHNVHEPDIFGKEISIKKTMPWKDHKLTTDRY